MKKRLWLRKIGRWSKKNIVYILATFTALMLMPTAIQYATLERGYSGAIGGEFLLLPLALLIAHFIKTIPIIKTIPKEIKEMWTEVNREEKTQ